MKNYQNIILDYCAADASSDVLRYLPAGLKTRDVGSNLDLLIRANLKVEELLTTNKTELKKYSALVPEFKEMRQTLFLTFASFGQSKTSQFATQGPFLEKWNKVPKSLAKMAKVFGAAAEVYTAKADALSAPSSFVKDDLAANRLAGQIKMSPAEKKDLNLVWNVVQEAFGETADNVVGGLFYLEETAYRCKKISTELKHKAKEIESLFKPPAPESKGPINKGKKQGQILTL